MEWTRFYPLAVFVVCVAAYSLASPVTSVAQGRLRGSWMRTRGGRRVAAFRGIPYAQPPVNELRFKSPLPVKAWHRTRTARSDGAKCVQHQFFHGIAGEEDCLYLNVFTPNITGKLPVLFFIHGGAYKLGSGSSFLYGPNFLLDEDILLVTINFRLNLFGFLSLEDAALPGNLGLKDQREALRWVRDNIAQFGGDPARVTAFGESSGAQSVHYHMLFNSEEGLFRAGILHSGSVYTAGAFQRPGEQRPLVEHLLNKTRCAADDKSAVVECLRKVPAYSLLKIFLSHSPPAESQFKNVELAPVIEPDCVEDALVKGNPWNRTTSLPIIIGTNQYEGLFILSDQLKDKSDKLFEEFARNYDQLVPYNFMFAESAEDPTGIARTAKHFYLRDNEVNRANTLQFTDMISDGMFNYGVTEAIEHNLNKNYLYSLNYHGSKSFLNAFGYDNNVGATHVDDIFLFFPFSLKRTERPNSNKTSVDALVSKQLIKMWTNFVTKLDPTPEGSSVEWSPVSKPDLNHLVINGPDNFTMEPEFYKERMHFWRNLPFRNKPLTDLQSCVE